MGGHRKIGRPKLRWSDVIRHEGETNNDRRSTGESGGGKLDADLSFPKWGKAKEEPT